MINAMQKVTKTKKSGARYLGLLCISMLLWQPTLCLPQTAKQLSIDSCYAMARRNYPLVKQMGLIEKTKAYSIDNAAKGYLPQLNVSGQATYQSEVTALPISMPDVDIPSLSKDQYRIYTEINQPITDLFTIDEQMKMIETNTLIAEQKVEIELYQLRERINQLFFGILLIDAQIRQLELLKRDIQSGIDKINAAIANGTALKSSADVLRAELLKAEQRNIELEANRQGYSDMLAQFINQPIDERTKFEKPANPTISEKINRPELRLYDLQKKTFDIQNQLIRAKTLPKFNFFFQGGYGRPALNQLSNDFSAYYLTGLRLNWNLSSFYTINNERQQLFIEQNTQDVQKETFLFNTRLSLSQQNREVSKYITLLATDNEIIALRESIKSKAGAQLENGTITPIDYLSYINTEDQARQDYILHEIQLLLAQYKYQTTAGNY